MPRRPCRGALRALLTAGATGTLLTLLASPALAVTSSIDYIEPTDDDGLRVVVSLDDLVARIGPLMQRTASEISAQLGYRPGPSGTVRSGR